MEVGKFMCPAPWRSGASESPFSKSEMNLPASSNVGHSSKILRPAASRVNHHNGVTRLKNKIGTNLKLNAVLMDPTSRDLQKRRSSLLEFGQLSQELMNPTINHPESVINSSSSAIHQSTASGSSSEAASGLALSYSDHQTTVGEALTTHAQRVKARSPEDSERFRRVMIPLHKLRQGGFVENCFMYRQVFVIRSYEVGADKTTSIDKIFSLFQQLQPTPWVPDEKVVGQDVIEFVVKDGIAQQHPFYRNLEVALCHVHLLGIAGEGFGATRGMNELGLIWVVSKMQVNVERFPEWPEAIEIDTWVGHAGKNGMRRDWVMRCYQTGELLARATSTWCMMNASTRRLSKIPDVVRAEIEPCFMDDRFAFQEDEASVSRIPKLNDDTADFCTSQLKSQRGDLDMNQHVNNLKYISWLFESIPLEHLETHRLTSITLEYRRECQESDIVESLTKTMAVGDKANPTHVVNGNGNGRGPRSNINGGCELAHLLRIQDSRQDEILRGRTTWLPKANHTNSQM